MKKVFVLTVLFFLSISFAFAEKIIFSANNMTGKAGDSNTTTTLSGNAYIKTETMEIQAETVELSGEDYRYIKAAGNVVGKNIETNMEFTCEGLDYDRTTKIAELKGNVDLTDVDNDVKAKAQVIVYNQDTDIAILQIKVNLLQDDNVCTGSYAVYYKATQILEISGNAQVKQKDDVFRAQFITLDMNTQDITLGGNVKGTVTESKSKADSENTDKTDNTDGTESKETDVSETVFEENAVEESVAAEQNEENTSTSEVKTVKVQYDESEELEDLVDYSEEN